MERQKHPFNENENQFYAAENLHKRIRMIVRISEINALLFVVGMWKVINVGGSQSIDYADVPTKPYNWFQDTIANIRIVKTVLWILDLDLVNKIAEIEALIFRSIIGYHHLMHVLL